MKNISSAMSTELAKEVTTLAWCWRADRRDGLSFGFTSHDVNLVIDGLTYYAETGLNSTNAQAKVGANVDNLEVAGILDASTITEEDVRKGLWDGCEIKVFIVNWKDVTQQLIVQSGTVGDITVKKIGFVAEMRSLSQFLQNTIGRLITRRCDATFGDARCGFTRPQVTGSVTNIVGNIEVVLSDTTAILPNGTIEWTSGNNNGSSMEVKSITGSNVVIMLPMNSPVAIGDTYILYSGCDKNFTSSLGCSYYGNQVNFRGFPTIPGLDAIMEYPSAK